MAGDNTELERWKEIVKAKGIDLSKDPDKVLQDFWNAKLKGIHPLRSQMYEAFRAKSAATTPSELHAAMQSYGQASSAFVQFAINLEQEERALAKALDKPVSEIIKAGKKALEPDGETALANIKALLKLMGKEGPVVNAALGLVPAIIPMAYIDKLISNKRPPNNLKATISAIQTVVKDLEDYQSKLTKAEEKNARQKANYIHRISFQPLIWQYKVVHSNGIYGELERYGKHFNVSPDEIEQEIRQTSPETANALMKLLRATYQNEDLQLLQNFAQDATATNAGISAFLQFMNHAVIPHQDYFEIWASKMHDLAVVGEKIAEEMGKVSYDEHDFPPLELFNEKPISLSGTIKGKEAPADSQPGKSTRKAAARANATKEAAVSDIQRILNKLHDRKKGDLVQRHAVAMEEAIEKINSFTAFYTDVGNAVARVEQELARLEPQRDRTESRWSQAESVATSQRINEMQTPGVRLAQSVVSSVGGAIMAGQAHPAVGAAVGAANISAAVHNYQQQKKMLEVQSASLKKRAARWGDDEALKEALEKLDKEIKKLEDNKALHQVLANEPALEEARQAYMLLPRLTVGEANIDALQMRLKRYSYETIDDFLDDINKVRPRLAEAMENFLIGFADSNDLTVIIAEANAIRKPDAEPVGWQLFVRYVESSIKEHFRDHARQASIVDVLKMRNVLCTGTPFHSFGEVVKMETDSALKALFAGDGAMSLIGSEDVHQIFGYYMERHGKRALRDPYAAVTLKNAPKKHVDGLPRTDLENLREGVMEQRTPQTAVPRLNTVFTEICAYEYFLTQGANFVKDNSLAANPYVLEGMVMVNDVVIDFTNKLALHTTRKNAPTALTPEIESLIAQSFIDFFAELGAKHANDVDIVERKQRVSNAYLGGNYSLASSNYGMLITEDAQDSFDLFLQVYKQNLEEYLEVATRDKRDLMLEQLDGIESMMSHLKPDNIRLPNSPEALERARFGNNTLAFAGVNRDSWVARATAIHETEPRQLGGRR